jgi:spermidine synthase
MRFTELDWVDTPLGEISLRRRLDPALDTEVFEVKLGDEYLMSSLFTVAEEELSRLGLAAIEGSDLDVVVGGLGLGYTARAALEDPRVRSLTVVEALAPVIDWHERDLLPGAAALTGDPRTTLLRGDFFALVRDGALEPVHALLVDIDHSPDHTLNPGNGDLYTPAGLRRAAALLHPGGVFALWSDDPPEARFQAALGEVFAAATAHVIRFPNPLTRGESTNTVYVATV